MGSRKSRKVGRIGRDETPYFCTAEPQRAQRTQIEKVFSGLRSSVFDRSNGIDRICFAFGKNACKPVVIEKEARDSFYSFWQGPL